MSSLPSGVIARQVCRYGQDIAGKGGCGAVAESCPIELHKCLLSQIERSSRMPGHAKQKGTQSDTPSRDEFIQSKIIALRKLLHQFGISDLRHRQSVSESGLRQTDRHARRLVAAFSSDTPAPVARSGS